MKYKYIIVQADEDGNPLRLLKNKEELNEYLEDNGIDPQMIMSEWPEEEDPNYWKEKILILEINDIIKPKVKLSV